MLFTNQKGQGLSVRALSGVGRVLTLSLVVSGVACSAGSNTSPNVATSEGAVSASNEGDARQKGGGHGKGQGHHEHGGVAFAMFRTSMGKLNLDDGQKAKVRQAEGELRESMKGSSVGQAKKELASTLADGVDKGAIDPAAVDARLDALSRAVQDNSPKAVKAVNTLHATLSPSQRKELATDLVARLDKSHGHERHTDDGDRAGKADPESHGPLVKFAEGLSLSSDQKRAMADAFRERFAQSRDQERANWDRMKGQLRSIADAFAKDDFDAAKVGLGDKAPQMARERASRMAEFAEVALPVLTAEQRTLLARRLREFGAWHSHEGKPRKG